MKMPITLAFAAISLLASVVFAHSGDVTLRYGDIRVGNYKLISITNSELLLLDDLSCNASMNSQRRDIVQDNRGQDTGADVVDVSSCYPSKRYAFLSINQLSKEGQIGGYNYILSLELANNTDRFPIPAYWTEHHAALARCSQNQNRLTCSILRGGEIVLDLL